MWTKKEKDYIREHYDFVKAGEKGTEATALMAKLKGSDIKEAVPVFVCNEEVDSYVLVKPCPFCGEHHHIGDYFIANKQEYDEMWDWAEEVL